MVKKEKSPPPRYREVYAPPEDHVMARPCGIKCCKVFLIALNFLFLVSGLAILGLGVYMQVADTKASAYMEIFNDDSCNDCSSAVKYFKVPYVLMAVGGFVVILSFLGCCGSWAESTCLLCLYSVFLFLILAIEIGTAIFMAVYSEKITKCFECSMSHQVHHIYNNTDYPRLKAANETHLITKTWDLMQEELECCGGAGPQDYYLSAWYNYTHPRIGINVPKSCCYLNKQEDMSARMSCQGEANFYDPANKDEVHHLKTTGCHKAFMNWMSTNVTISVVVLITMIVLQILDLIAACLLLSRIRAETSRHQYVPPGYYPPS